jgi:flagellar protein FlaG
MVITQPVSEIKRTMPVSRDKQLPLSTDKKTAVSKEDLAIDSFEVGELNEAVDETNRIVFGDTDRFEFKIHEGTGRIHVKLVDNETDEVIREIPPEKILNLIANIWEMVGILVDERG